MGSIWKHDILDILLLNCSWVDKFTYLTHVVDTYLLIIQTIIFKSTLAS